MNDEKSKGAQESILNDISDLSSLGSLKGSVYHAAQKLGFEKVEGSTLKRLWRDPVGSKLISSGIVFFLTILSAIFIKVLKNRTLLESVKEVFTYKLEIWIWLMFLAITIGLLLLRMIVKRKYFKGIRHFPFGEQIGNFRFFELFNILISRKQKIPESIALQSGISESNHLILFMYYVSLLNIGVDSNNPGGEHGNFIFYQLGPQFISFGLCEKVKSINKIGDSEVWSIQTSETGRKFFSWAEKLIAHEEYINS